jgi:hypothetical protein
VHGLTGKKSNNCGQSALPVAAGPWVRAYDYKPFAPTIDKLLAPTRTVYYPPVFSENSSTELSVSDQVWTGTDDTGVYQANDCSDWTSNSFSLRGVAGNVHGGGTSWTKAYSTTSDPTCDSFKRLRCVEVGGGPPMPPRHPTNIKRAFLTSVSGNGNLASWADSNNLTSMAGADQVCQARARYAGYANPSNFKAWFTYTTSITSRIVNTSLPYVRPDGIVLGTSRTDMLDGKLAAPWEETETNQYVQGNYDTGYAWTGLYYYGSYTGYYCSGWSTNQNFYYGTVGVYDSLDTYAINRTQQTCDLTARLYCVED